MTMLRVFAWIDCEEDRSPVFINPSQITVVRQWSVVPNGHFPVVRLNLALGYFYLPGTVADAVKAINLALQ